MQIVISIKNVYGNELYYPECNDAILFAQLADSKTLTKQALNVIAELGYEIIVKSPQFN